MDKKQEEDQITFFVVALAGCVHGIYLLNFVCFALQSSAALTVTVTSRSEFLRIANLLFRVLVSVFVCVYGSNDDAHIKHGEENIN